jgi:formylglycine-generating enzyme required for sulfatase activity
MNEGAPGCGTGETMDVKNFGPSTSALFDMAGNVAEWTLDWYSDRIGGCGDGDCTDPIGPAVGDEKVVRGGSYNDMFVSAFRTAKRDKDAPNTASPAIGGRCVR